jgi:hypothetical protein
MKDDIKYRLLEKTYNILEKSTKIIDKIPCKIPSFNPKIYSLAVAFLIISNTKYCSTENIRKYLITPIDCYIKEKNDSGIIINNNTYMLRKNSIDGLIYKQLMPDGKRNTILYPEENNSNSDTINTQDFTLLSF